MYVEVKNNQQFIVMPYRPDYFLTNSKDADNYLTAVGYKKLGYYGKIISVIKKGE